MNCWLATAEIVPAFARFLPRIVLRSALGTPFLPRLQCRLRRLRLRRRFLRPRCRCSRRLQANEPGFVGFLHGALRMHAAGGIGCFPANRTKPFRSLRLDDDGTFAAHDISSTEASLAAPSHSRDASSSRQSLRRTKNRPPGESPAAGVVFIGASPTYRRPYAPLLRPLRPPP